MELLVPWEEEVWRAIFASDVFVENRVPLKCRAGCVGYGKKLTCSPYVPTVEEIRKVLSE